MTLQFQNGQAFIGIRFELTSFPSMLLQHADAFPETKEIEDRYAHLKNRKFEDFKELSDFIKSVCKWGNYAGVGGKVLKNNGQQKIQAVFDQVRDHLFGDEPDLGKALSTVNTLHGLGTPSFASKHLRFMSPAICPVYDSILTDVLPYSFDPAGYAKFANDCSKIALELEEKTIRNPIRENLRWFACDVEAAIFSQYYE